MIEKARPRHDQASVPHQERAPAGRLVIWPGAPWGTPGKPCVSAFVCMPHWNACVTADYVGLRREVWGSTHERELGAVGDYPPERTVEGGGYTPPLLSIRPAG